MNLYYEYFVQSTSQIYFGYFKNENPILGTSRVVLERVPDYPSFLPETDYFWATRTRLFRSGRYPIPTRTRLFEKTHTIWGKKCIIPDKISDFLGTRIRLFGIPALPDTTRIRLFTIRSIRYPTFCYPLHH